MSDQHQQIKQKYGLVRGLGLLEAIALNMTNMVGFGPFITVYLTAQAWTQIDIGLVLSVGGLVALFGQTPGGAVVDAARAVALDVTVTPDRARAGAFPADVVPQEEDVDDLPDRVDPVLVLGET